MSELKTLKDIPRLNDESSFVELNDLKKEAIKWVKFRDKNRTMDNVMDTGRLLWKDWIDFFNITEEDLK